MLLKFKCYTLLSDTDEAQPLIAAQECPDSSSILFELRGVDREEEQTVQGFLSRGCGCSIVPGGCCQQFAPAHFEQMRSLCAALSRAELDLILMGQIMSLTNNSELTVNFMSHRHKRQERVHSNMTYFHQGLKVCRATFLFLHGIGTKMFKTLRMHCKENGLVPRVHGNTKRLPANALTFADVQRVVAFVQNYAEDHAILLPGRIPGYKRTDLQLLPSSTTKLSVWRLYTAATADDSSCKSVAYSTFGRIWQQLLPHILPTKPMSDLCAVCHQSSTLISRSSNLPEVQKTQVI